MTRRLPPTAKRKRLYALLPLLLVALVTGLAHADEDEVKVYGVVSYLTPDRQELRLNDLRVTLDAAEIEGVLSLGATVEVEGHLVGEVLEASEVEVAIPARPDLSLYRGQVIQGRLLGLELPGVADGSWVSILAPAPPESGGAGRLEPLLLELLVPQNSATPTSLPNHAASELQAPVQRRLADGFIAGGVRVISGRPVEVGEVVTVIGNWDGQALHDAAAPP